MNYGSSLHRIIAPFTPRIAPQHAPASEQCAAHQTVLFHCLKRIFRTRRMELAITVRVKPRQGSMVGGQCLLVKLDKLQTDYTRDVFYWHMTIQCPPVKTRGLVVEYFTSPRLKHEAPISIIPLYETNTSPPVPILYTFCLCSPAWQ